MVLFDTFLHGVRKSKHATTFNSDRLGIARGRNNAKKYLKSKLRSSARTARLSGCLTSHPIFQYALNSRSPSNAHLRTEEHTSELTSLMRISYAVFYITKQTDI